MNVEGLFQLDKVKNEDENFCFKQAAKQNLPGQNKYLFFVKISKF